MHEAHLFKNLMKYLKDEETSSCRKIKRIHVALSEFGGMTDKHFREHYEQASSGTRWKSLDIRVDKIPYGPEFEITKIDFA